jgi:signal transduction histidine kinase
VTWLDWVLGCVVGAVAQLEVWLSFPAHARYACAAAAVVAALAVVSRRWLPARSAAVALVSTTFVSWVTAGAEGVWPLVVGMLVLYAAGRYAATPSAVAVLMMALTLNVVPGAAEGSNSASNSVWEFLGNYAFVAVLMIGMPWGAGAALRRRERVAGQMVAEAAEHERMRIARELHDVVGHSLGVIAVQAGAERATLPADAPTSTRETLSTIEHTTREALAEMRRLVAVLRQKDAGCDPRGPQPRLAEVEILVNQARAAGLATELSVDGDQADLSAGVELAAYRVVQEALTNAVRHSGGTRASVRIDYQGAELVVEITDNGTTTTAGAGRIGFGLVGMRERVALYGGSLVVSPRADRGFVVCARLPYNVGP